MIEFIEVVVDFLTFGTIKIEELEAETAYVIVLMTFFIIF